jgi:hypothetical protein
MYFLSLDEFSFGWVTDPFVSSAFKSAELNAADEDGLTEINDRRLKTKPSSNASFQLSLQREYSRYAFQAHHEASISIVFH